MKQRSLWAVLFILGSSPAGAAEPDGKAIIEEMIQNLRDRQNIAHYEMTIARPQWTRTLQLKAWDRRADKKVFILIEEPAKEKGKTFLRIDYNLWMYLPAVEKVIKIPSSMMLQPWMGSDFSNDDLVKESSYIDDYVHEVAAVERRDGVKAFQIKLVPKPHAPVVWGSVIFWVREKPYLPLQQDFYNEQGELVKQLRFTVFKKMDQRLMPTVWIMDPVKKKGQRTILTLKEIAFVGRGQISDTVFTKENLKRPQS